MVEMSEYVVDAWIHPKYGGDDHQVKITFQAVVDFRFVSGKGVN